MEGQDVPVVDGVHNGIGMQLVAEGLLGGAKLGIAAPTSIDSKNRRAGETKQVVLLKVFYNGCVHIPKLAAVALVEDNHNALVIDLMALVLRHKGGELLNGGDDDPGVGVLQLLFQDGGGGVGVGRALLKAVVLLHGLVVQVFPVHHEQHLIYVRQQRGQPGGLETGEGLAGACGVPDVPAPGDGAIFFVVVRNLNTVQDALGGGDLIGPHDHQHLLRGKNAVPCQHVQEGVLGEKCAGEIYQIRQNPVVGVGPERRKLKAVAGLFLPGGRARGSVLDGVAAGSVGVILGVRAIRNDENLYIVIQPAARPKAVPLVAVDLVERLPDSHAPAFQLDMDQRQTIHQNRDVITVIIMRSVRFAHSVLVDDL